MSGGPEGLRHLSVSANSHFIPLFLQLFSWGSCAVSLPSDKEPRTNGHHEGPDRPSTWTAMKAPAPAPPTGKDQESSTSAAAASTVAHAS